MDNSKQFSGKNILVTGASGFIGKHLCRDLILNGGDVYAISRSVRSTSDSGIKWLQADLQEINKIEKILSTIKPHFIFHLASQVTGSRDLSYVLPIFNNNLLSTVNLLTAASKQGCERAILIGSMEEPFADETDVIPNSPYTAAKWASSAYGRMFHALYQLPVVILRIFMVYGPGQLDLTKLIPYVITTALKGESPKISSGNRKVDWIYVDDVVDGIISAALAEGIEGKTLDIGSRKLVTIQQIVENLIDEINPDIKPIFGAIRDRILEKETIANTRQSEDLIRWRPKTSLKDGLQKTIDWYNKMANMDTKSL